MRTGVSILRGESRLPARGSRVSADKPRVAACQQPSITPTNEGRSLDAPHRTAADTAETRVHPEMQKEFDSSMKIPTRSRGEKSCHPVCFGRNNRTNENVRFRHRRAPSFFSFPFDSPFAHEATTVDSSNRHPQSVTRLILITETFRFKTAFTSSIS